MHLFEIPLQRRIGVTEGNRPKSEDRLVAIRFAQLKNKKLVVHMTCHGLNIKGNKLVYKTFDLHHVFYQLVTVITVSDVRRILFLAFLKKDSI